jgi:hypothetical protein
VDRYVIGAVVGAWGGVVSAAVLFLAFAATGDGDATRGGLWSSLFGGVIVGVPIGLLLAHGLARRARS